MSPHKLPRGHRDDDHAVVRAGHRHDGVAVEQVVVPLPPAHHVCGRAHAQVELAPEETPVELHRALLPPTDAVPLHPIKRTHKREDEVNDETVG